MKNTLIGIGIVVLIAGGIWYIMKKDTTTGDTAAQEAAQQLEPAGDPYEVTEGLTAQEMIIGDGVEATSGMYAAVLYEGRLDDGTVFDSTAARDNQPFVFLIGAGQVIQGWDLGVAGMKVGGVRRLVIDPALAYGDQEIGVIPANSRLTFDVQLLAAEDAAVVDQQIQEANEAAAADEGTETSE